jgi:hypothetical protein
MEQNNITNVATLTKDQVNALHKDILREVEIEVAGLYNKEITKVTEECDKFIEDSLPTYNKLIEIREKISKYNEQFNQLLLKQEGWLLNRWGFGTSTPNVIDIEEVKSELKSRFLTEHNLSDWERHNFIQEIVSIKIKAILVTLTNTAYEDIIKVVREKLNLSDLFDNRQKS